MKRILSESLYDRYCKSNIAQRLARGSLWSLIGSAVSRILVLIAMILVARILGKELYGEFGLIQTTLGMVGLFAGMGLGGTATRFVAHHATTDPDRAGRIIALIMSASVATVVFSSSLLIIVSGPIAVNLLDAPQLRSSLILGSVLMAATAFRGIQSGALAGLEKFDLIAKLNVLDGVVSLIAMVILSKILGVKGAILGLATGASLVWVIGRFLLYDELKKRHITVRYQGCWSDRNILTGYSLPSLISSLVATPILWFSMTLLSRTEDGFSELGLYNAAYQWHGPMVFIPMIFMSVSIPVLVQEWEKGNRERFRKVIMSVCGFTLAVTIPPSMIVAMCSSWIMNLYGQGFREGYLVLIFLVAAAPVHGISKIIGSALLSMNRAWWMVLGNSIWGGGFLVFAFYYIPSEGALGLAKTFLIAHLIAVVSKIFMVLIVSNSESNRF